MSAILKTIFSLYVFFVSLLLDIILYFLWFNCHRVYTSHSNYQRISNFTPRFITDVITYPYCNQSQPVWIGVCITCVMTMLQTFGFTKNCFKTLQGPRTFEYVYVLSCSKGFSNLFTFSKRAEFITYKGIYTCVMLTITRAHEYREHTWNWVDIFKIR